MNPTIEHNILTLRSCDWPVGPQRRRCGRAAAAVDLVFSACLCTAHAEYLRNARTVYTEGFIVEAERIIREHRRQAS